MRVSLFLLKILMEIVYTNDDNYLVSGTPAAVTEDGVMYINTDLYYQLTPFQREFIKWHEVGHYRLHTHSEFEADEYAFHKMAGKYYQSLKKMIGTLEAVLDEETDPNVPERIEALYKLCLQYDAERGNRAAAKELRRLAQGGAVMRGDGENAKTTKAIEATSKGITDALNAASAGNVANTKANTEANSSNDIMMYLFLGVVLIMLLKD